MLGCSQNVPLTGTVKFSDGTPLTTGTISFTDAKGSQARGDIDSAGRYVVGFKGIGDGLPSGEYQIAVSAFEYKDEGKNRITTQLVDVKFMNKDTSGLRVTIDKSVRTHDVTVERPPKPVVTKRPLPDAPQ
ncbi:hypothetical protein FACS1894189_7150 [Planctomycetales bacterium]|nr:hypothetical protein FACS1894189_7150 [Planctomycetales bacterium]